MTDEHNGVDATENTAVADQPAEADGGGRRGRPRDPGVIERDARVLEALSPGEAKTKAELASELNLEPNVVYLSLWRLHKDGQITRNQRAWQRA